jgi:hypothetical protein
MNIEHYECLRSEVLPKISEFDFSLICVRINKVRETQGVYNSYALCTQTF